MPFKIKPARLARAVSAAVDTLENRCLFAALVPSAPVLVFNSDTTTNGANHTSHTDTLTITNSGSTALTGLSLSLLADPSDTAGDQSADFHVTSGALPTSLAAGASANVTVNFTASAANTIESALLRVASSDPAGPLTVQLHGLGTNGQFGTSEPSLANILTAFDIPTNIGVTDPSNSQYPLTPSPASLEVPMQRLVKAGTGPVTIQMLASFNASAAPSVRFGYYTPGESTSTSELFTINNADDQTVNPTAQGATSFDPGSSAFSLYANFPGIGATDTHYSETSLNVPLDSSNPQKFRFFPLENADGTPVANAYVVAAEDYNGTAYHSFTNVVAILRNVQAAPNAVSSPVMGLTNLNAIPGSNVMAFNRIQNVNPTDPQGFTDPVHDTNTLQIMNTGDQPLQITALTLSDATNWQIVNPPSLPATVAAGGTLDVTVQFIATANPSHTDNQTNDYSTGNNLDPTQAGGVWNGTLTVTGNDPSNPSSVIPLAGYWQNTSENENEPGLQTIVNSLFGYTTVINNTLKPNYPNYMSTPVYYGEEEVSGLWNQVDPSLPVSVHQLTSYHNQFYQGTPTTSSLYWSPSSNLTAYTRLFTVPGGQGQTLFPLINGSPAAATFTPSGTFAWNLDGESSVDSQNTQDISLGRSGHGVRFWPARDAQGNQLPDTWIMSMDYENTQYDNSDFQDNVYVISNVRPASYPPSPTDLQATAAPSGGVNLQWAPVNDGTLQGYNIYRSATPTGPWTKVNTSGLVTTTSYTDNAAPSGTLVYYGVSSADSNGTSRGLSTHVQTAGAVSDVLTSQDINATPAGATAIITPGKAYDLTGGGVDIGGTNADGFRYAYESVTGDFDVSTQVISVTQTVASNAKAGIMARATLDPGSQMVFSGVTPSSGYRFNDRTVAGAVGSYNSVGSISYPNAWVRLTRVGDVFTAYSSSDGQTWTQMGTLTLPLPSTIYLGLAADSHSTSQTLTAQFRNFNLINASSTLSAPAGLTASAGSTGITLQWAAVSGAAGYNIYSSTSATGPFSLLNLGAPVTGTNYTDGSAATNSTTYYQVVAVDGSGHTSSPATTSAVRPSTSTPENFGGRTALTYTDDAGHKVTLRLTGPGSGVATFNDGAMTPDSVNLTGTTAATTLTITVAGGSTHVGTISVTGSLGHLAASKTLLQGDLAVTGTLGTVQLAGASGGHTLSVGAPGRIAMLNLGQVTDLSISSASAVGQLLAATWANSAGTDMITAPSITRLAVTQGFAAGLNLTAPGNDLNSATLRGGITGGPWTLAGAAGQIGAGSVDSAWAGSVSGSIAGFNATGNFAGTLTAAAINNLRVGGSLTGSVNLTGGTAHDLRALTVGGAIDGGQVRALGSIGTVATAGLIDANVFAGIADSTTSLPASPSDFAESCAISSVVVTGRRLPFAVQNSNVAAQTLGRVNFGPVDTDNAGVPFGLASHALTRYTRRVDGKVLTWTSHMSPSLLTNSGDAQARLI